MTEKSQACPHVYTAINAVMQKMAKEGIGKDRRNQQQGYNFRGIDDVYNTLCGVMAAEKLLILPFVQDMTREERVTAKGGLLLYTILTVDFTFVSAVDGSTCQARMRGEAMDSGDKSCNKAQSAALKYATMEVFMIPTEGDNDADATTHEVAAKGMPDDEYNRLTAKMKTAGVAPEKLLNEYDVRDLRQLNQKQFGDAMKRLDSVIAEKAKAQTNDRAEGFGEVGDVEFA